MQPKDMPVDSPSSNGSRFILWLRRLGMALYALTSLLALWLLFVSLFACWGEEEFIFSRDPSGLQMVVIRLLTLPSLAILMLPRAGLQWWLKLPWMRLGPIVAALPVLALHLDPPGPGMLFTGWVLLGAMIWLATGDIRLFFRLRKQKSTDGNEASR